MQIFSNNDLKFLHIFTVLVNDNNSFYSPEWSLKKLTLSAAFLTLLAPLATYPLEMGKLSVYSHLDEPFFGEIDLLDIGHLPLQAIQVDFSSPVSFARMGIKRSYLIDQLQCSVSVNEKGKPVIKVTSTERINSPYLQLLIQVQTSETEVSRAYTALLDPPNYSLAPSKQTSRMMTMTQSIQQPTDVRNHPSPLTDGLFSYGPSKARETVWQIAQRHKSSDFIAQQIVLAIVGSNPEAFIEGNLNGLKTGSILRIPSTEIIKTISADAARLEVSAHDLAWHEKKPIVHALLPPYHGNQLLSGLKNVRGFARQQSEIVPAPIFIHSSETYRLSVLPSFTRGMEAKQQVSPTLVVDAALKFVQTSVLLLESKIHELQLENKNLSKQYYRYKHQVKQLQEQVRIAQGQQRDDSTLVSKSKIKTNNYFLWSAVLALVSLVAFVVGYRFWGWRAHDETEQLDNSSHDLPITVETTADPGCLAVEDNNFHSDDRMIDSGQSADDKHPEETSLAESVGGYHADEDKLSQAKPTKNKRALTILLDLAKQYTKMGDIESAKHSLEDVLIHGNAGQQEKAKYLLKKLNRVKT
ncbi:MAG: FimV/HubP family polar landmark protein [Legionella sp.]